MKGNGQFTNLFLSNHTSFNTPASPRNYLNMKQSLYLNGNTNFKPQTSVHSSYLPYSNQNLFIQQPSQQKVVLYGTENYGKQSMLLERSRSQIIQPIYTLPIKKDYKQDLERSNQLGSSKASQVTFSKPSEFIINSQKQILISNNLNRSIISPQKIYINNDYGYNYNTNYGNKNQMRESFMRITSPLKQSYMVQNTNPFKNSTIINQVNHVSRISPHINSVYKSQIQDKTIYTPNLSLNKQVPRNSLRIFSIKPQLKRALSTISIMSNKSKSNLSGTKVNFNYISPPKSQTKTGRKLSFKKQDTINPLSKLNKKKQQKKSKLQKNPLQKVNSQAVNQYFPEFKIKKNKLKSKLSPNKKVNLNIQNKEKQKSQISDDQRRHTFIASLQAFSQISEIKLKQKEQSTQFSTDTPNKMPQFSSEYYENDCKNKVSKNSITFNKLPNNKTTSVGGKNSLKQSRKQQSLSSNFNKTQTQKDESLSLNSMKNGQQNEFIKKHGGNSQNTTANEQDIIRKITQDLGLNFAYYKK